jgi:hypothetical protein
MHIPRDAAHLCGAEYTSEEFRLLVTGSSYFSLVLWYLCLISELLNDVDIWFNSTRQANTGSASNMILIVYFSN